jgi:tRNA nucleotidyltransferase (CCA-adding enzyme)
MPLGALDPQTWPFDLDELPPGCCLVGGAVRDVLLNRQSSRLDLDFVVPQAALEVARAIARHHQTGFVVLDAERGISRLVFPQATVDFAQQEGPTLETDLQRRDFTVNAIAYDPHQQIVIDPVSGQHDLQQRCLRMITEQNLRDDPLRLLRAYRQAAQLGFQLEARTQASLRKLAPLLIQVAAERVLHELTLLLEQSQGTAWLVQALADGLLQAWLPSAAPSSAAILETLDQAVQGFSADYPASRLFWQRPIPPYRFSSAALAKLTALLSPLSRVAAAELGQLKASRRECSAVSLLRQWQASPVSPENLRQQADLFHDLKDILPAFVLLTAVTAPALATTLLERYLCPEDAVAHPQKLIDGQALMAELQLRPSPQLGSLLRELRYAQAEGRIGDRAQALDLAASLLSPERQRSTP